MLFLFDILPLEDIIHETIMPMLDYESRIALNQCFAPNERYRTRFSQDEIIRHELYVVSSLIKSKMTNIDTVYNMDTGTTFTIRMRKKAQRVFKILQLLEEKRAVLMMQHLPSFRKVIIDKLTILSDPYSDDLQDGSRYFRQKISAYARVLIPRMKSIVPTVPIKGHLRPLHLPVRHMSSRIV